MSAAHRTNDVHEALGEESPNTIADKAMEALLSLGVTPTEDGVNIPKVLAPGVFSVDDNVNGLPFMEGEDSTTEAEAEAEAEANAEAKADFTERLSLALAEKQDFERVRATIGNGEVGNVEVKVAGRFTNDLELKASFQERLEQLHATIGTSTNERKITASRKTKPRVQQKRLVGTPAKTINQMKDVTTKQVASTAVTAVTNLQKMTVYDTELKKENNPYSDTLLVNFDAIVPFPRSAGDGEKGRKIPVWTVLAGSELDQVVIGERLEALGRAMKGNSTAPKKGAPKKKVDEFEWNVTSSGNEYLDSLYGESGGNELLAKRKRYKTSSDEE